MVRFSAWIFGAVLACLSHSLFAGTEHSPVAINFGLGGSWYSPDSTGQGFVFDVVPGDGERTSQLVVYWFTYAQSDDGPGAQRWFLADGEYLPGDDVVALEIHEYTGGQFDQPGEVQQRVVGSAKLTFSSCASARLDYEMDFDGTEPPTSGQIDLERLTPDVLCKQLPRVDVQVPERVEPGAPFTVVYQVTNHGPVDLTLVTPHSCLANIRFYRDREQVPVSGQYVGCLTVITQHELPVGETVKQEFQLHATSADASDASPLSAGNYQVKVRSEVVEIGGIRAALPVATGEFEIDEE